MNCIELQRQRDSKLLAELTEKRFLTARQISCVMDWSYKPCIRRLTKMAVKYRSIKRFPDPLKNNEYIFYLNKKSENWRHWILLNSCFCFLKLKYKVTSWQTEVPYSMIRPDAYCRKINAYIEIDLANNPFNKVPLYNKLFDSDEWLQHAPKQEGEYLFPSIIVVTTRKAHILEKIKRENKLGLNFIVWHKAAIDGFWK